MAAGGVVMRKTAQSVRRPTRVNARGWRMDGIMAPDRRRSGQEPLRQSVHYNEAENADLLAQYKAGARLEDIAAWHQRGVNGIGMQLERLGAYGSDPLTDRRRDG